MKDATALDRRVLPQRIDSGICQVHPIGSSFTYENHRDSDRQHNQGDTDATSRANLLCIIDGQETKPTSNETREASRLPGFYFS